MSFFQALFPLAQRTTLSVLITTEDEQLRVSVIPSAPARGDKKPALYPLSLIGTPDELDRDFAAAVAIYEPGGASVLDQARAAAAANTGKSTKPASLPAPAAEKRGPGRPRKNPAAETPAGTTPPADVDPRQQTIDDALEEGQQTGAPAAETPAAPEPDATAETAAPADDAVDTW